MSLYYYDLLGIDSDVDDEGTELASLEEAKLEAIRYAGSVVREHPQRYIGEDVTVQVRDALGLVCFTWWQGAAQHPEATLRIASAEERTISRQGGHRSQL